MNESGDVSLNSGDINVLGTHIYAFNGQVDIKAHNAANSAKFAIGRTDRIFAANGINIDADEVDLRGANFDNLKTGYSVRGITITDDMLKDENLLVDPVTGEKNLIDMGGNRINSYFSDRYDIGGMKGNIKAIFKDGQIYLYDIPALKYDNGINIVAKKGSSATLATYSTGSQSVTIDNKTDKTLVVGDIINTSIAGKYSSSGLNRNSTSASEHQVPAAETAITSNGKVILNGRIINGIDGKTEDAIENSKLTVQAQNDIDISKHQSFKTITAGGLVDIAGGGALNVYGDILDKNGDIVLYGANGTAIYGTIEDIGGNVVMTARRGNLLIADSALVIVRTGDVELYQEDPLGALIIDGEVIIFNGVKKSYSAGYETDNGRIFVGIFSDENDLDDLTALADRDDEFVVTENMDFGWDVSKDKGLSSSVKILRMNSRGATIVNAENWKVGDKPEITISFENVNITLKCQVIKVEGGLAQVKFKNMPSDVANKITYRYMRMAAK